FLAFALGQLIAALGRIGVDIAVKRGEELPHAHVVDLLRGKPHRSACAVDRGYSELSVGEVVVSLSASPCSSPGVSSGAPCSATPRMPRASMTFSSGGRAST